MQTEEGMGEGPECLLVFRKVESILFNFVAAYGLTLTLNNTEHICSDGMCLNGLVSWLEMILLISTTRDWD